jgi:hypothetical protein
MYKGLVWTTSLDCPELTLKGKINGSFLWAAKSVTQNALRAPLHLELQVYDLRMTQHHSHSALSQ